MKALILNGSLKDGESLYELNKCVEALLTKSSYEVESVLLHEKQIADCAGCFGCWVKTPGICIKDDYSREVTKNIINSDVVVHLTPVTFGGYSSELKKAVDRTIPLLLPFFRKVKGEVHHKPRYKSYPKVIVLGTMAKEDAEESEIFNSLVSRNAANWYNTFIGTTIKNNLEADSVDQIRNIFKAAGVNL